MKYKLILVLFSITFFVGCSKKSDSVDFIYNYSVPLTYTDGIETGSLESVGMEVSPIRAMMDYINSVNQHRIHNILILKNNKLVFEEYFSGYKLDYNVPNLDGILIDYNRTFDHPMMSVSKSVTSVIFGIAVKDGYITNLDKKIIDYFPEYADILIGEKANITIHHLLSMTCGITLDESTYSYADLRNELRQVMTMDDPIRYILSRPLLSTPGTHFYYSSGTGIVLSAIIEKVTGMRFLDYANSKLFDPLRSEGGVWTAIHNGLTFASGGLYFKARELTKIGLLFLNDGQFEGNEIITPDWIRLSQQEYIGTNNAFFPNSSYGYQWWNTHYTVNGVLYKCFFAAGWGGQYMFIIPGLDMIIEINSGDYYGTSMVSPFDLVNNYILKAIISN